MVWEIPLQLSHNFSSVELNRWLRLFDSPNCKVTQAQDGSYYLTACRFEKLANADAVKKSADKLIVMMIAIAKIELDMDFPSIGDDNNKNHVSGVRQNLGDSSNVTAYPEPAEVYSFVLDPTVEIRDEQGNIVTQPRQARWYDHYLDQCDDSLYNKVEFRASSYFAEKTEPRTLRLVYELIRDDEGDKHAVLRNGWFSKTRLDEFWYFIHYHDLEGKELHAKSKTNPPTMSLEKARVFVANDLLKKWLIKKAI